MSHFPTHHANLPDTYADWLMNLTEFRANGYIDTDLVRTPYGVRLSSQAFWELTKFGDDDDGVIRRTSDGTYQMWFEGLPYTVNIEPLEMSNFEPTWDDDEISLLVWAAQAPHFDPLAVHASNVETDSQDSDEVIYLDDESSWHRGAPAIISYLRSIDADRATAAEAVDIDPDTPDDLLEAAAWSARTKHAKRLRDDMIRHCARYDIANSKRDLARTVGLSGTAAIDRIITRETND